MKSNIVILGSTGSIGRQALEVVDRHSDHFRVIALAAKDEVNVLAEQIKQYRPEIVGVSDREAAQKLKTLVPNKTIVVDGFESLADLAVLDHADIILIAVSGIVGIIPTLKALKKGKRIALANKETIVTAGQIVMDEVLRQGGTIIPVDSEHSAIFQCQETHNPIRKIILTASGGPFRDFTRVELQQVDVAMALNHPNWDMGPKISIDSATLMNKGLEVIEAHYLFSLPYNSIEVVVHRESIIHSMVQFSDNSYKAHLGASDMRIPIQYAFTYPKRYASLAPAIDFTMPMQFTFTPPDLHRFPALKLAYAAGEAGGTMPAVLNAANEVAVQKFISRDIPFLFIATLVEKVMNKHQNISKPDLDTIMEVDDWARKITEEIVQKEVGS